MAFGFAAGALPPEQSAEGGTGISKQRIAANEIAQLTLGFRKILKLVEGQGITGAGHGKTGAGIGGLAIQTLGLGPIALRATHIAEVVERRGIEGIALEDPVVIRRGLRPTLEGFLSSAPIEMGIGILWCQGNRAGLIGDRPLRIPQHQADVAAVAPGGGIPRRQLQHLIPEGQRRLRIALAAQAQGPLEQARQVRCLRTACRHHRPWQKQQGQQHQQGQPIAQSRHATCSSRFGQPRWPLPAAVTTRPRGVRCRKPSCSK